MGDLTALAAGAPDGVNRTGFFGNSGVVARRFTFSYPWGSGRFTYDISADRITITQILFGADP
jgi:hypothetical protein